MSYIGIDIGTTNIKIVETDEELNLKNKIILEKMDSTNALQKFINENNINLKNIEKIVATGVGTSDIEEKFLNIEIIKVPEFIAIANGGKIVGLDENYIVASIGTGTAFVKCRNKEIEHIGGTGVGGGTLINLCRKIVPNIEFDEINKAIEEGNLENVDLMIKDITKEEIKTLPKDITAANFGKLSNQATKEDIIKGIVNMIFESIGVMSTFAAKGANINNIVAIGQITKMPYARQVLDKIEKLHNVKFIIPENSEYMTAIGAVKYCLFT